MPVNNHNIIPDNNRAWILGGAGVVITVVLSLGGIITNSLQSQINTNQARIYEINSKAVTNERLDRQIKQVTDYIDVRVQSLESQQREINRQLTVLVSDNKDFQKEVREALLGND